MKTLLPFALLLLSTGVSWSSKIENDTPLVPAARLETAVVSPGTKSVHVLVQLRAQEAEAEAKPKSLNLALVLDRSGSMSGAKIADARSAAIEMLDHMRDGDRVALVSYSDEVRVDASSTVLNEETRTRVRNAIHRISDDGSTNLGGGLVEGLKQIRPHSGSAEVNRVLLISDGLANRGIQEPNELNRIAREALQEGLVVTTIGLGADYNEDLMTGLADHGGGNYYFIPDSTQIAATLNDEIRQMAATVAKNVALMTELPHGIGLDKVHGWVPRREEETVIVPLGEFFSGQLRSVLWRFELPDDLEPGDTLQLAPIVLTYNDLTEASTLHRIPAGEALEIKVSDDKDVVAAARDVEVAARIAEIELATSMETAANLVNAGNYDEAKNLLRQAANRAQEQGAALPEAVANDLLSAAKSAEELEAQVDEAKDSARESKLFTKGGKAASQALQKK